VYSEKTKEVVMIPKILEDVAEIIRKEKIVISEAVEGEGRGGSLKDEGTIIRFLENDPILGEYILSEEARRFGDMTVLDYDGETKYVVNIKTSIGSSDNATSKIGFLYALTDMEPEEMPGNMNWKKFMELLNDRKADIPTKDYWFLCVDKNNSSNVMIRGAKQINCWTENANPANMLQIGWKKEKELTPIERTYDESYEVLVGGIKRCIAKFFDNLPEDLRPDAI
jgi:hypothetical protein|tara:strand:+ start:70 stop:744 length:675 start_codon:yes stop_codon:yes gene_type:complete